MDCNRICSVCLKSETGMLDISTKSKTSAYNYEEVVNKIAQLELEENFFKSGNICLKCRDACDDYMRFRSTIINSYECQSKLSKPEIKFEVLDMQPFVKLEVIEELDSWYAEDICSVESESEEWVGPHRREPISARKRTEKTEETFNPEVRLYSCKTCNRNFTTERLKIRHELVHSELIIDLKSSNKSNYWCIYCNTSCESKLEFKEHIEKHRQEIRKRPLSCIYCEKPFKTLSKLKRHLQGHDENKTHMCKVCDKKFAVGSSLIEHIMRHKGYAPFLCDLCNKSFRSLSKIREHMKVHSTLMNYLCMVCGRSFQTQEILRRHNLVHMEKKFKCSLCPAKFVRNGHLKVHLLVHDPKKSHMCSTCGSTFSHKSSLKKHQIIHTTNSRKFKCDVCDMRFYNSYHVNRHKRTHTGEKPYKCEFCDKAFSQNGDLNKHKRLHVGENIYKCTETGCNEAFRFQRELRDHYKVHYCKE